VVVVGAGRVVVVARPMVVGGGLGLGLGLGLSPPPVATATPPATAAPAPTTPTATAVETPAPAPRKPRGRAAPPTEPTTTFPVFANGASTPLSQAFSSATTAGVYSGVLASVNARSVTAT
jgi:hypothetical protein